MFHNLAHTDRCISSTHPATLFWIVARTKPRQELNAIGHLAQRELEGYCPMFLEPPWHRRAPKSASPLFVSYIFVSCDPRRDLRAVRFCPGVAAPVVFDHTVAAVSDAVIASLREREGDRGWILPEETVAGIKHGSAVEIMDGPLHGLRGVFGGYLRGGERAQVLLEFLRHTRKIEVNSGNLRIIRR